MATIQPSRIQAQPVGMPVVASNMRPAQTNLAGLASLPLNELAESGSVINQAFTAHARLVEFGEASAIEAAAREDLATSLANYSARTGTDADEKTIADFRSNTREKTYRLITESNTTKGMQETLLAGTDGMISNTALKMEAHRLQEEEKVAQSAIAKNLDDIATQAIGSDYLSNELFYQNFIDNITPYIEELYQGNIPAQELAKKEASHNITMEKLDELVALGDLDNVIELGESAISRGFLTEAQFAKYRSNAKAAALEDLKANFEGDLYEYYAVNGTNSNAYINKRNEILAWEDSSFKTEALKSNDTIRQNNINAMNASQDANGAELWGDVRSAIDNGQGAALIPEIRRWVKNGTVSRTQAKEWENYIESKEKDRLGGGSSADKMTTLFEKTYKVQFENELLRGLIPSNPTGQHKVTTDININGQTFTAEGQFGNSFVELRQGGQTVGVIPVTKAFWGDLQNTILEKSQVVTDATEVTIKNALDFDAKKPFHVLNYETSLENLQTISQQLGIMPQQKGLYNSLVNIYAQQIEDAGLGKDLSPMERQQVLYNLNENVRKEYQRVNGASKETIEATDIKSGGYYYTPEMQAAAYYAIEREENFGGDAIRDYAGTQGISLTTQTLEPAYARMFFKAGNSYLVSPDVLQGMQKAGENLVNNQEERKFYDLMDIIPIPNVSTLPRGVFFDDKDSDYNAGQIARTIRLYADNSGLEGDEAVLYGVRGVAETIMQLKGNELNSYVQEVSDWLEQAKNIDNMINERSRNFMFETAENMTEGQRQQFIQSGVPFPYVPLERRAKLDTGTPDDVVQERQRVIDQEFTNAVKILGAINGNR